MKKILGLVAIATLVGGFLWFSSVSADDNLALNKSIVASSQVFSPVNAVDGNANSYWEGGTWNFPSSVTVDLGASYDITSIVFKLPPAWGNRTQNTTLSGSLDNSNFTTLASGAYAFGTHTVNLTATVRYVRASISSNSSATAAQIGELEVYGTATPPPYSTPYASPYSTPYQTPYATPYPTPAATWPIQGVDVMKYSKDVLCSPPSQSFMDDEADKAVELGANYLSISGFYDSPSCGSALTILTNWVNTARAHDLKVWFRMKDLRFEGDYGTSKTFNPDGMRHQKYMVDWIAANNLVQNGDIFTPNAEPQNGGINGVTWCGSPANCQFTGKSDFNIWLQQIHTMADLGFKAKGLTGVKVGYYGFDGFIAAGLGNPDWQGQSQLEASTIAMMGPVAIDHYPETIGHYSM